MFSCRKPEDETEMLEVLGFGLGKVLPYRLRMQESAKGKLILTVMFNADDVRLIRYFDFLFLGSV